MSRNVTFISEISAQPILGGGITLQKILGEDFQKISCFIKTISFPSEPDVKYEGATSYYYKYWKIECKLRKVLGCRLAFYLSQCEAMQSLHRKYVAREIEKNFSFNMSGSKILASPNSRHATTVLNALWKKYHFEYITWLMDDHMVKWRDGEWKYFGGDARLMREHLRNAKYVFVISEAMAEFYKDKFSVDSQILHAPCESLPIDEPLDHLNTTGPCRLVYFGSLGRWQNDAIEGLVPHILDKTFELNIFTRNLGQIPDSLRNLPGVFLHNPIAAYEINKFAKNFDAMVLPISFKKELKNMSFFNIATKFSDCIGAPIPTIIIGPSDSIMVKTAKKYGAFVTVESIEPKAFKEAFKKISSKDTRTSMLAGRRLAFREICGLDVMTARWKPAADFLFN